MPPLPGGPAAAPSLAGAVRLGDRRCRRTWLPGDPAGRRRPRGRLADNRVAGAQRRAPGGSGGNWPSRVNTAVAELGYTANLQARAVATGQSTMVGVVVHDIADPYFSSIAAGLIEVADARGLLVCLSSTAASEAAEREYVALMHAQRARAVILIGSRSDEPRPCWPGCARRSPHSPASAGGRSASARTSLAWTRSCRRTRQARTPWPGPWSRRSPPVRRAGRAARPADSARPAGRVPGRARRRGRCSLDPAQVIHGAFTRDGGYEAISTILAMGGPRPDCVFAVTDVMAVGALARLRAGGIEVPGDIAVAGFDDISRCATSTRHSPRSASRSSGWARWPPTWPSATRARAARGSFRSPARSSCARAPSRTRPRS